MMDQTGEEKFVSREKRLTFAFGLRSIVLSGLLFAPIFCLIPASTSAVRLLADEGQEESAGAEAATTLDLEGIEEDGSLSRAFPKVRISDNLEELPPAVAKFYDALMKAARTGEVENLRPLFGPRASWPQLGFDDFDDPITFLMDSSNDGYARETLAILLEIMQSDYAVLYEGTPQELYVWPYFAEVDLEKLTSPELVQMYKLVAYQDLEEMLMFGAYFFFRLGIDKDGNWQYFLAGD